VDYLAFSPDGSALFVGSGKGQVVQRWAPAAWEKPAGNQQPERTWSAPAPLRSMNVHPTEGWLVCVGDDGQFYLLSATLLQPLRPPHPGQMLQARFTADGTALLVERQGHFGLLNLRTGQVAQAFAFAGADTGSADPVSELAVSPDGALVASASTFTRHVHVWQVSGGRLLADLPVGGGLLNLAFAPDSRTLAVTGDHRTVLYDLGGRRAQTLAAPTAQPILALALHPDGRSLAMQTLSQWSDLQRDVLVWGLGPDSRTPLLARHTGPPIPSDPLPTICFDPARQAVAFSAASRVFFQDSAGRAPQRTLAQLRDVALGFGADGRLWGASGDQVRAWDAPAGQEAMVCSNALADRLWARGSLCSLGAGRQWVAVGGGGGGVQLFLATDPTRRHGFAACQATVWAVALSGDDYLLAAGSDTGELCLLTVPDGTVVSRVSPHQDRVAALAWSGDGLLASGSRDQTVKLWRRTGDGLQELLTLRQPAPVRGLAFHPDGARLFVLVEGERAVHVWHLDQLFDRLAELGLGADLGSIRPAPLPPPAPGVAAAAPDTEAPRGPQGLKAEVFADVELGRCVKVRYDSQVDQDWGGVPPALLTTGDGYSLRWTGWLKPPRPGRYTLQLDCAQGARLWLDGQLLLDRWQVQGGPLQVEVEMAGRPQELRIECMKLTGPGFAHFRWAQAGGFALQPVPASALSHDPPR
jgi:WD40 repeat protein